MKRQIKNTFKPLTKNKIIIKYKFKLFESFLNIVLYMFIYTKLLTCIKYIPKVSGPKNVIIFDNCLLNFICKKNRDIDID